MRFVACQVPALFLSLCCALGVLLSLPVLPAWAAAQPTFTVSFDQSTIGPGSATLVRFVVNNSGSGTPASGGAFTATLPAGITLTSPAGASSTCADALLDAPAGGTTLALTGARVGGSSSCTVSAYVTSSTPGGHTLVSGDFTSSAGNSGTASATLTVATDRPGVTLSASPASVPWQGRTTLTYTFDNTANASAAFQVQFNHPLPAGVTVASPSRASTDCTGSRANAVAGAQVVGLVQEFVLGSLAAGGTCTLQVDVRVGVVGDVLLVSDNATAAATMFGTQVPLGRAAGVVTGTTDRALVRVDFLADPVAAGSSVELQYTLYNRDRNEPLTGLAFQHDLGATITGLAATSVLSNSCGGTVGTGSTVNVSAVALASGADCQITLSLSVPPARRRVRTPAPPARSRPTQAPRRSGPRAPTSLRCWPARA